MKGSKEKLQIIIAGLLIGVVAAVLVYSCMLILSAFSLKSTAACAAGRDAGTAITAASSAAANAFIFIFPSFLLSD